MSVLETDRLVLRPFRANDLDLLQALYGDPEVMRYVGSGAVLDREQTRARLEQTVAHWHRHGYGMWALVHKHDGRFVGRCGLAYLARSGETALAYLLVRRSWGRGLATEAASRAVRFAFETAALRRLAAYVHRDNAASQGVLRKVGMACEGPCRFEGMDALRYGMEPAGVRVFATTGTPREAGR
jgi:RimJ/RimL family protein N-acetyltransferase